MREVDVERLVTEGPDDPVLRHFLDLRRVRRGWTGGAALVVEQEARGTTTPMVVALGPPDDLGPLLADVARTAERPGRVVVDVAGQGVVPAQWPLEGPRSWFWMTTTTPVSATGHPVEELTDPAEVDALLDVAFPDSHTRPATAGAECWLGVRLDGRLAAAGALTRRSSGAGHLGGIATHPSATGRGLGTAVTAALTDRALAGGPGVSSLGVYTDNTVAVGVYRRLGYRTARTFVSGPVAPAP